MIFHWKVDGRCLSRGGGSWVLFQSWLLWERAVLAAKFGGSALHALQSDIQGVLIQTSQSSNHLQSNMILTTCARLPPWEVLIAVFGLWILPGWIMGTSVGHCEWNWEKIFSGLGQSVPNIADGNLKEIIMDSQCNERSAGNSGHN